MPGTPSRVIIRRTHADDVGQRQIYVRVDDGPTHTLRHGQDVTIEIPPGPHTLRSNNTLYWKTLAFEAAAGEEVEFAVVNKAGRTAFGLLALLGVGPLKLVVEEVGRRPANRPDPDAVL
jgi:hypothetical protein